MKEEINGEKELLESKKFNNKFSKNILENGAKNYMQGIYTTSITINIYRIPKRTPPHGFFSLHLKRKVSELPQVDILFLSIPWEFSTTLI